MFSHHPSFTLYLHYYPLYDKHDVEPLTPVNLDILFPPGTGFAVREPFLGQRLDGTTGSIQFFVHVLTPTDVEVYRPDATALCEVEWATASPFRPSSSTCAEQRALADAAQRKGSTAVAVKRMTDALALAETPGDMAAAALQRSLLCVDTRQYGLAYRDTSIVKTYLGMGVELSNLDQLQLHARRCQALLGLGLVERAEDELDRFDEACPVRDLSRMTADALDEFQEQAVLSKQSGIASGVAFGRDFAETALGSFAVALRRGITRMRRESEVGVAAGELAEMEAFANQAPFADLKVGHYVGPIRVAQLKKRRGGRGVIATRDIEPGELLLGASVSSLAAVVARRSRTDLLAAYLPLPPPPPPPRSRARFRPLVRPRNSHVQQLRPGQDPAAVGTPGARRGGHRARARRPVHPLGPRGALRRRAPSGQAARVRQHAGTLRVRVLVGVG